jgi:2-polyprenyl-3-methyl-5-hydroxy-6-metoxy-1,4-benzoquinol methylase
MLEKILEIYKNTTYNFIDSANEKDPLKHLFEQWLPYYKLKWAVANAIKPKRVLEIGVRFGYSAMAFLDASPECEYVGIDANLPEYGGEVGAFDWAKMQLKSKNASFIEENSQDLVEFPGGHYDLIHVDGQQDGDGFYRDMQKALKQGKYILVDGALWTNENALSSISFIKDYIDSLEWSIIIPGYAGELLIKVKDNVDIVGEVVSSQDVKGLYQDDYYLEDCGGFHDYKLTGGKVLGDPRLKSVFMLADIKNGEHVLDAGCGRGEMAYALAKAGATVEAIDYSDSAVALAKQIFNDEPKLREQVRFKCEDITEITGDKPFDSILASDLIEHLMPAELDKMYANFSSRLSDNGEFVIHTFPNLWFYKYGYERQRRTIRNQGGFLSPEPRTHYERLMHINEQSPRVLKKQLEKHFTYVLVWFGDPMNPIDSLNRKYRPSDCIKTKDLFAIASNAPISIENIKQRLTQNRLTSVQHTEINLEKKHIDNTVRQDKRLTATINVQNNSSERIASTGKEPIHLSYHWLSDTGDMVVFEGERAPIPMIRAGQKDDVTMQVLPPTKAGEYILQIVLLQEQVAWFETSSPSHMISHKVIVNESPVR